MHTAGLARQQQAERPWIPPGTPPARCPLVEVEYWREMAATLARLHTQVPLLAIRPCVDTDTGLPLPSCASLSRFYGLWLCVILHAMRPKLICGGGRRECTHATLRKLMNVCTVCCPCGRLIACSFRSLLLWP